jgi:hypothetical protein
MFIAFGLMMIVLFATPYYFKNQPKPGQAPKKEAEKSAPAPVPPAESKPQPAAAKAKAPGASAKVKDSGKTTPKQATAPTAKRASKARVVPASATFAAPPRDSKQSQLIASLRPAAGVTIGQMMALTGWQAHTVRGAISGVLRKKLGLNVTCEPSAKGGERLYRIVDSAASA